jgi:tetratricopeptide (TPR) repeat protein
MLKKLTWDTNFLAKLNGLQSWQVAVVIGIAGLVFFFSGLGGGFQGDDDGQIVDNTAVHSLSNIGLFFKSSTFWNGQSLVGDFYRPIMTTTFAFIYSLFGANPVAYHVVQLLVYMTCSFVLYLFLKKFFKSVVALFLSLIFLLHPMNTQVVYAIPSMQEPLFFLFGILALYVVSRSQTTRSLIAATGLLFLSLLSKETGVVFVLLTGLYLLLNNKVRLTTYLKLIAAPVLLFVVLRYQAVGLFQKSLMDAPIDFLNFGQRILMIPSMLFFYLTKFIFPYHLATSYYWTYKSVTFMGIILPLIIVLVVLAVFAYCGFLIHKKAGVKKLQIYLFFAVWALLSLLPYLQIIPLDMTACLTWFFCAMPGFLGMIALIWTVLMPKFRVQWLLIVGVLLLLVLGIGSEIRGFDYHSQLSISLKDVTQSSDNYLALNNVAKAYIDLNEPTKGLPYVHRSISLFPLSSNYINLGVILQKTHELTGAKQAYEHALTYVPLTITYENIAIIDLTNGNPGSDTVTFLKQALVVFPTDNRLWTYLAIQQAVNGSMADAQASLQKAIIYGPVPQALYYAFFYGQPLTVTLPGAATPTYIP